MKLEEAYETISRCSYNFSPEEIEFDVSKLINYETLAMHWIKKHKTLPPKELLHEPSIKDIVGYTCAMHWIVNVGTLPLLVFFMIPLFEIENYRLVLCFG